MFAADHAGTQRVERTWYCAGTRLGQRYELLRDAGRPKRRVEIVLWDLNLLPTLFVSSTAIAAWYKQGIPTPNLPGQPTKKTKHHVFLPRKLFYDCPINLFQSPFFVEVCSHDSLHFSRMPAVSPVSSQIPGHYDPTIVSRMNDTSPALPKSHSFILFSEDFQGVPGN